ncbi:MAG: hypothetical protein OEW17_07545 [Gemmatimonadota bacterium]|nr:hypothetical protein [Gemmatimonadota bacterium]
MKTRLAATLLMGLAACAPKSEPAPPAALQEVTFTATEFAFTGPDSIAPGFTKFTMVNQGAQDHHLIVGRFGDGQTLEAVMAFMKENPTAEPPGVTWHGGANAVAAGGSAGSIVDLAAGRYLAICFMPDPADGAPHLMKGMLKEFVVAGTRGTAVAPESHGEVRLKDFGFTLPPLSAGTHTFHVVNDGPQTHEIQLVRLNDGATAKEFLAALATGAKGPPPGVMMGGPGAYSAGGDGYWPVTLSPGNYVAICFVPDPGSGAPHVMMGMMQEFAIPAS